jgi:transcriptional regulator with XRE-family HTH domain
MRKKGDSKQGLYLKKVGSNIRQARNEKGLSQEALALAADLDRSYIGGVERGERNISILNLKKIAGALNISVSQLLKNL